MPPRILELMLTQGMDMAQASLASGISTDPKLGEGEGLIGALRHMPYPIRVRRHTHPLLLHPPCA